MAEKTCTPFAVDSDSPCLDCDGYRSIECILKKCDRWEDGDKKDINGQFKNKVSK